MGRSHHALHRMSFSLEAILPGGSGYEGVLDHQPVNSLSMPQVLAEQGAAAGSQGPVNLFPGDAAFEVIGLTKKADERPFHYEVQHLGAVVD